MNNNVIGQMSKFERNCHAELVSASTKKIHFAL